MSGRSYKNLIKSGFYFNKKVFKYRETDLTEIKNEIRGVGFRSFYFFTRKVEFQKKQLTSKFSVNKPNELALINSDLLKNVPVNADVINLHRYNILRKYLIRSFKGRCHIKGKPVNGQRT